MKIHKLYYDPSFPFVKGLTTLRELMATHHTTLATQQELNVFCAVLKKEYLLQVKYIPVDDELNVIYLKVPSGTSETKIGWLFEIFKFYTSCGVGIKIVESDECDSNFSDYLNIQYNIEKDIHHLLTKTGKMSREEASPVVSYNIRNTLNRLVNQGELYEIRETGKDAYEIILPSKMDKLNIDITLEL